MFQQYGKPAYGERLASGNLRKNGKQIAKDNGSEYNRENEMYNLTKRNVQLGAFSA